MKWLAILLSAIADIIDPPAEKIVEKVKAANEVRDRVDAAGPDELAGMRQKWTRRQ